MQKKPIATMITSRGCPFGCPFCCKSTFGSKYRERTVENVLAEIKMLANEGYKEIHIVDDNFTLNIERTEKICLGIIESGIKMNFVLPNGVHAWKFNEKIAMLMRKAGFYFLWFGVETRDPKILSSIRKGITLEQVYESVQIAKRHGFFTGMYFMVGLPESNEASEMKSLEFAKKCSPDVIGVSVFTAYPGSPVYDGMRDLSWNNYRHDFVEHKFTGKHFDDKYILEQFDKIS